MAAPVGRKPLETLVAQVSESKAEFRELSLNRRDFSGEVGASVHEAVIKQNNLLRALRDKCQNIQKQISQHKVSGVLGKFKKNPEIQTAVREIRTLLTNVNREIRTGQQLENTLDPRGLLTRLKDLIVGLVLNRPKLEAAALIAVGVPAAILGASAALNAYVMPSALNAASTVVGAALKHAAPLVGQYCR